jgi:hypothetical protein
MWPKKKKLVKSRHTCSCRKMSLALKYTEKGEMICESPTQLEETVENEWEGLGKCTPPTHSMP